VTKHLPKNAPLSTFRVITQSRGALDVSKKCNVEDVTALSCVFRAGRMGALTDHDSVLFDVDPKTGEVLGGTTNAHWYRLGLHEVLPGRCPWRSKDHDITHHPDGNIPVSGSVVPNIREMLHLVETSHWKLCPGENHCYCAFPIPAAFFSSSIASLTMPSCAPQTYRL
jgi:hypothetical protein